MATQIVVKRPKLILPPGVVLPSFVPKKPPPHLQTVANKSPLIMKRALLRSVEEGHVSPVDTEFSMDEKTATILQQIRQEAEGLDDAKMRDLWLDACNTYAKSGNVTALTEITAYRRSVVSMEEFMYTETYLGQKEDEIYPGVHKACMELDNDIYNEAVLKGALGIGKTTIANIHIPRVVYKLSCMRHPQTTYGVRSASSLVISIQSIRLATAKKAVFQEMAPIFRNSPYFRSMYPYDPYVTSQMVFRRQNVSIMPVSSSTTGAISMNVIAGILDEMNFMQKIKDSKSSQASDEGTFDQAKQMYETITRRRQSRFNKKGKLPGIMFLISSSKYPDDFTEKKAAEATMCGGTNPHIYVFSLAQWEAKGAESFLPEKFKVQIGTAFVRSRILKQDAETGEWEQPDEGCRVIEVPMDFFPAFQTNVDDSLRDFGGITLLSQRPFIARREMVTVAMHNGEKAGYLNPMKGLEAIDLELGMPVLDITRVRTEGHLINSPRHIHVDLGHKRDACGLAMGHIVGQKLIERIDKNTGLVTRSVAPMIAVDLVARIVKPPGGEIEFAKVREFIKTLRDAYHYPIEWVTFDGFQSIDSRQILRKEGFKADYQSVEDVESYRSLRDALYEERVLLPHHMVLNQELVGLEWKQDGSKEKVDHPTNGSKDVADGVCGVVSFLLRRRASWAGTISGATDINLSDLSQNSQRVTTPALQAVANTGAAGEAANDAHDKGLAAKTGTLSGHRTTQARRNVHRKKVNRRVYT
jgi:hypothetical protein